MPKEKTKIRCPIPGCTEFLDRQDWGQEDNSTKKIYVISCTKHHTFWRRVNEDILAIYEKFGEIKDDY